MPRGPLWLHLPLQTARARSPRPKAALCLSPERMRRDPDRGSRPKSKDSQDGRTGLASKILSVTPSMLASSPAGSNRKTGPNRRSNIKLKPIRWTERLQSRTGHGRKGQASAAYPPASSTGPRTLFCRQAQLASQRGRSPSRKLYGCGAVISNRPRTFSLNQLRRAAKRRLRIFHMSSDNSKISSGPAGQA